jgi:hypothetical protein
MRWPANQMRPSLLENCTKRRKSASEGKGGKGVLILKLSRNSPFLFTRVSPNKDRFHQMMNPKMHDFIKK